MAGTGPVDRSGNTPPDVQGLKTYKQELTAKPGTEITYIPIAGGGDGSYFANVKQDGKSIGAILAGKDKTCVRMGTEEENTTYCGNERTNLVDFMQEKGPEGEKLTAFQTVKVELPAEATKVDAPLALEKGGNINVAINNLVADDNLTVGDSVSKKGRDFSMFKITRGKETVAKVIQEGDHQILEMDGKRFIDDKDGQIVDITKAKKGS